MNIPIVKLSQFFIALIICLLTPSVLSAQIMSSKGDILNSVGLPDDEGVDDNGFDFFIYTDSIDNGNRKFERNMVLYFMSRNGKEICSHLRVIYPISELESNLEYFDNNFNKLNKKEWIDPLTNYHYKMDNRESFNTFLIWLEPSAKVKKD